MSDASDALNEMIGTIHEVDALAEALYEVASTMPGSGENRQAGHVVTLAMVLARTAKRLRGELDRLHEVRREPHITRAAVSR